MSEYIELSIIMPCLNEAETLATCIQKAKQFLTRAGVAGEVIVGDNGSTDGSQEIARSLGARVIDVPVRGYGAALIGATLGARGRYCIMGDSDDSYDFARLELFLEELRKGTDLVMGNRFLGGIAPGAMPWKNRYVGNPALSGVGRILFRCPAKDFHCGLRGYSKQAFARLDLRTLGMEYASEMVIKATLMKMQVVEVPTTLSPDGRSRPPHLRPFRDGWRHLRFMLLFSPDWLFLYPGLLLLVAGAFLGGILFFKPITIGSVRLSIDTMIYSAAMAGIGVQAVLFAVLSRTFAEQAGLFPTTKLAAALRALLSFERGVIAAAILLGLGVLLLARALSIWSAVNFGSLNADHFTGMVVGSSLLFTIGLEIFFSTCLLSIMQLNIRVFGAANFNSADIETAS